MARARVAVASRKRRKKFIKAAKGFRGGRKNLIRTVQETLDRAGVYAYRDRKTKKRQFRRLWIIRINAAARLNGLSYSRFMNGLKKANVDLDRKILADMAINDPDNFGRLAELAKSSLS
ncbi:MAG: 50S ribosomal protein L20 [Gemmatimonadetes bacterium]|nr:MAG: 50S ribosomal protein L20 [Gemmatimonadota bacterium]